MTARGGNHGEPAATPGIWHLLGGLALLVALGLNLRPLLAAASPLMEEIPWPPASATRCWPG